VDWKGWPIESVPRPDSRGFVVRNISNGLWDKINVCGNGGERDADKGIEVKRRFIIVGGISVST